MKNNQERHTETGNVLFFPMVSPSWHFRRNFRLTQKCHKMAMCAASHQLMLWKQPVIPDTPRRWHHGVKKKNPCLEKRNSKIYWKHNQLYQTICWVFPSKVCWGPPTRHSPAGQQMKLWERQKSLSFFQYSSCWGDKWNESRLFIKKKVTPTPPTHPAWSPLLRLIICPKIKMSRSCSRRNLSLIIDNLLPMRFFSGHNSKWAAQARRQGQNI